jgi:hypothetical protein
MLERLLIYDMFWVKERKKERGHVSIHMYVRCICSFPIFKKTIISCWGKGGLHFICHFLHVLVCIFPLTSSDLIYSGWGVPLIVHMITALGGSRPPLYLHMLVRTVNFFDRLKKVGRGDRQTPDPSPGPDNCIIKYCVDK